MGMAAILLNGAELFEQILNVLSTDGLRQWRVCYCAEVFFYSSILETGISSSFLARGALNCIVISLLVRKVLRCIQNNHSRERK